MIIDIEYEKKYVFNGCSGVYRVLEMTIYGIIVFCTPELRSSQVSRLDVTRCHPKRENFRTDIIRLSVMSFALQFNVDKRKRQVHYLTDVLYCTLFWFISNFFIDNFRPPFQFVFTFSL